MQFLGRDSNLHSSKQLCVLVCPELIVITPPLAYACDITTLPPPTLGSDVTLNLVGVFVIV